MVVSEVNATAKQSSSALMACCSATIASVRADGRQRRRQLRLEGSQVFRRNAVLEQQRGQRRLGRTHRYDLLLHLQNSSKSMRGRCCGAALGPRLRRLGDAPSVSLLSSSGAASICVACTGAVRPGACGGAAGGGAACAPDAGACGSASKSCTSSTEGAAGVCAAAGARRLARLRVRMCLDMMVNLHFMREKGDA
ncbi:MAG: hypothetical protein H6640_18555 [Caldilineaceae bacterium]|nr:hypothetical protein [Caldilineaceae bacterium]